MINGFKMKNILLIVLCISCFATVQAQGIDRQVLASGGSFASAGGASISFTVGETAIQYLSASGASISQGFQQAGSSSTGIHSIFPIDATISAFPNPFVRFIDVKSDKMLVDATFQLVDVTGKAIPIHIMELQPGKYWRLQLSEISTGNYQLAIKSGGCQSSFPLTRLAP